MPAPWDGLPDVAIWMDLLNTVGSSREASANSLSDHTHSEVNAKSLVFQNLYPNLSACCKPQKATGCHRMAVAGGSKILAITINHLGTAISVRLASQSIIKGLHSEDFKHLLAFHTPSGYQ